MTSTQNVSGTIAGSVLPIRRAEELIATLAGVLSVRIVPSETGAVDEIHVLTTDLVQPKNTVRNIESALMAQLGLRVNHRKISIATTVEASRPADLSPIAPSPITPPPIALSANAGGAPFLTGPTVVSPPGDIADASAAPGSLSGHLEGRGSAHAHHVTASATADMAPGRRALVFEDVEVRRSRTRGVLCRVTLGRDGQEFVGESEGQESERSRIDLAARATLLAIVAAMKSTAGRDRSMALDGSTLIAAFDREFVFVSVSARAGREAVALTGSCEVRDSIETSAVLAVLDATNRWMQII